ncbi:acyl carrier protein [Kitasatospora sp. GAS204B]|uniref:acyl carrier protein n=1 Tax=unclassified Kitasatospora TaxID=2633591 RepID=UPI0024731BE2|nr:phosphopantetheine-binding protein [Kitasatospora sp. GAS204B]MDH6121617.1 acyl carrier protein [Kitasatospora sp. GAS204B]
MLTKDDFIRIVRDDLALPMNGIDLTTALDSDRKVSWDSLHMLRLVAAVERETGTRVPVGRLLEDRSLTAIYRRISEA